MIDAGTTAATTALSFGNIGSLPDWAYGRSQAGIAITGDPGSGKTTALENLAY